MKGLSSEGDAETTPLRSSLIHAAVSPFWLPSGGRTGGWEPESEAPPMSRPQTWVGHPLHGRAILDLMVQANGIERSGPSISLHAPNASRTQAKLTHSHTHPKSHHSSQRSLAFVPLAGLGGSPVFSHTITIRESQATGCADSYQQITAILRGLFLHPP